MKQDNYKNEILSRSQNDDLAKKNSVQRTIDQPMNEDLKDALIEEEKPEEGMDENEFYYRMHTGLVKIQALVRGFLVRFNIEHLFSRKKFL